MTFSLSLPELPRAHIAALATTIPTCVAKHLYTLHLFTCSDIKTIMLPVTIFAVAVNPTFSARGLATAVFWLWCHLLQCDIANQVAAHGEDAANRPWRPIPAGRIARADARALRWAVCAWNTAFSVYLGNGSVVLSLALTLDDVLYNDIGWSGHWLGKNVCNAVAYGIFELATTSLAGGDIALERRARLSVLLSSLVIVSTIHVQDFSDVTGDRAGGRSTIPIRFPGGITRMITGSALCVWSVALGAVWELAPAARAVFAVFGTWLAFRIVASNSESRDARTFVWYTVWLMLVHLMPVAAKSAGQVVFLSWLVGSRI